MESSPETEDLTVFWSPPVRPSVSARPPAPAPATEDPPQPAVSRSAPDIDSDTFRDLAAVLQRLSGRITLYESSNDKAIRASKKIHGNPHAGEPLLIIPGMDTIDASSIDTDFLAHSYFSDNWPLLSDIHSILSKDDPPASRFGLQEMKRPEGKYYAFRP